MKHLSFNNFRYGALALFFLFCSGCSMQIISEYDQVSMQNMQRIAKLVDEFYARLATQPLQSRPFEASEADYVRIEVELNALKLSQQVRELNDLTIKQVDIVIKLWLQDIEAHKKKDNVSNFIINRHRNQFNRTFLAMIKGEQSKPEKATNLD